MRRLSIALLLATSAFAQKPYISPLGMPFCLPNSQIPCTPTDPTTAPSLLLVFPSSANTTGIEYHISAIRADGTPVKADGYFRRNSVDGASFAVLHIGLLHNVVVSIVETVDIAKQEAAQ